MRKSVLALLLVFPLSSFADPAGPPAFAAIFADHMVLQRGIPCPVWGRAAAGAELIVTFGRHSFSTTTQSDGKWKVTLPALRYQPDQQPLALNVESRSGSTTIQDVLIGDVWLFGGQSNMAFPLERSTEGTQVIQSANDPLIRICDVNSKRTHHDEPAPDDLESVTWQLVRPDSVAGFSAVAYYFGKSLRQSVDVPLGLIDTSVGGTPMRFWMSRESMESDPLLRPQLENDDRKVRDYPNAMERYQSKLPAHRKNPEKTAKPTPPKSPDSSYRLAYFHTSRILPLQPFAIKGIVWYQGESDAGRHTIFKHQFTTLVEEWRREWGQEELPWLYVQLAPFSGAEGRKFPLVWEAQSNAQDIPNSAMVVTLDHGVSTNIHPPEKRPVGERLARAARRLVYHQDIPSETPSFKSVRILGNQIILTFDHPELGLTSPRTELGFFKIAGADKTFHRAAARLGPDHTVIVTHPAIRNPVAVRYGWYARGEEVGASLFSTDEQPVPPFRTDDWEL